MIISNRKGEVPIWEKYMLTVSEAAECFNIGVNKMYKIVEDYMDSDYKFVIQNGNRTMIKRLQFAKFLDGLTSI